VSNVINEANAAAFERICAAEPLLLDVRPAIEVVPGMTPATVLTSGAPRTWDEYVGGQRDAIVGGALYEGLAVDPEGVDRGVRAGTISIGVCQDHACVGSLAGIYTASMPVFVVENATTGEHAFCNLFEGPDPQRLNYGIYNQTVADTLDHLRDVIGPILGEAIRAGGPIELKPIMRRALNMGDELHSRNTAGTVLFSRELFPRLLEIYERRPRDVRDVLEHLSSSDYFFLRLSMAASKATADAAREIEGSSVVTAMVLSCGDFAIRVGGLGGDWFRAAIPRVDAKLFDGHTDDDVEFMGGESCLAETVGLGGFAQAAALTLQDYQGGSPERMAAMNREMYDITVGEHPYFRIPLFGFRGCPTGIDVHRVVETGITPVLDIGVAGRGGGQIGAGVLRTPLACFAAAAEAHTARYGHHESLQLKGSR
jgi:Protein of unknown function (DUF1116)